MEQTYSYVMKVQSLSVIWDVEESNFLNQITPKRAKHETNLQ
jgi:hypothetical protein